MSEAAAAPGFSRLLSDERLTRRAVGGDERAFGAIFNRYHQSLYRFCLAILGNAEDAQDALQNTMIKVLRALPGEERQIELKPWLYRIARNEAIDLLRRRRETRQLDVEQIAPGHGLAEDVAARERLRRLITDMKELPERQREVLVMRELSGLGFDEIGNALETSGAVARQTLYEARQSLRQMQEGREMRCAEVSRALSDGDGRVTRRRDVRAHLRSCASCRAFGAEIETRQRDLAALAPLPALAAAGMLHGLIGGSQGATGGGLAATLGGGAAKTIGASAAAKGVATAAVVAAIGVTAADQTGVIHLGLPGEKSVKSAAPSPGTELDESAAHVAAGASRAAGRAGRGVDDKATAAKGTGGAGATGAAQGAASPVQSVSGSSHSQAGRHPAPTDLGGGGAPNAAEQPTGQGHEGQLPAAATDGGETVASHKPPSSGESEAGQGEDEGSEGDQATPPTKPSHPTPPTSTPNGPPEEAPANPPKAAPAPPAQLPPQANEHAASSGSGAASEKSQGDQGD